MKVVILTPTPPDISSFGVRSLSAWLREQGHRTTCVFLPGGIDRLKVEGSFVYRYRDSILEDIRALCRDADCVGISFMTQYFDRAKQLTAAVREATRAPIVWGGVHPTMQPVESLAFADYVVEGEGELPFLRLLGALDGSHSWDEVPNTWRKIDGNPQQPVSWHWMNEIESLPPFDFSIQDHFVIDIDTHHVVPLNAELLARIMPRMPARDGSFITVYRTMTSRGCPHQCAYCFNRTFRQRYCTGTYLRRRSVTQVIEEIAAITARYPFIGGVHFFDDSFFSNTMTWLNDFAALYKEKIGLPFYCQGSPDAIGQKKMELFLDAGMVFCEMGIQTGSPRIAELYHRHSSNDQIRAAIGIIDRYRQRLLKPHYHIIVDCPWETLEDVRQTIDLLLTIPHPFMLCLASLTLFPGTELNEKALAEGIIQDPIKDVYRKAFYRPRATWTNLIITLSDHYLLPRFLLRAMARPAVITLFQREALSPLWGFLMNADKAIRYGFKFLESLRYGNLWRISQFFRKN